MHVRSAKILIELDEGLMGLLDAERGDRTRVGLIRQLISESLTARAIARGEEAPSAEPVLIEKPVRRDTGDSQAQLAAYLQTHSPDPEVQARREESRKLFQVTNSVSGQESTSGTKTSTDSELTLALKNNITEPAAPTSKDSITTEANGLARVKIRSHRVVMAHDFISGDSVGIGADTKSWDRHLAGPAQTPGEQRLSDIRKKHT